ncbi:SoxR reducing system RseC family protein [Reinekea marina]|uniref:SoxR reducing system RseC family protein n=1 Tax=Reinekea marina TaxID=1310421 RepID=A0ABV7WUJ8_9GAMM|nr:SoxR reducing system RseC family protein [Reinekea marina]MBU2865098.1 SoxR reducing system RseC family protein [Reinekea forsetii]MDN3650128.1 SoxR reducing system RseC family protein [Reinekea marina]
MMIEEQGSVVAVKPNEVIVEVLRTSACQSCKAKQGCGQAVLSEWGDETKQQAKNHFSIPTEQSLQVGDTVTLGMHPDVVSHVAMIVYIAPLMVGFVLMFLATKLNLNEAIQLIGFVGGILASYVFLQRMSFIKTPRLTPEIVRVYGKRQPNVIASSN